MTDFKPTVYILLTFLNIWSPPKDNLFVTEKYWGCNRI
jgi:hypothetical protein